MPSKSFTDAYAGAQQVDAETGQNTGRVSDSIVRRSGYDLTDKFGSFVLGAADTITFGYLDEAGAVLDSAFGEDDYETALKKNREVLRWAREEQGGANLTGQIVGGFVPFMGWGSRSVKGMAKAGAGYGALYGSGSADGDLKDRAMGALEGGLVGAVGGYVIGGVLIPGTKALGGKMISAFKRGKVPALDADSIPRSFADDLEVSAAATKSIDDIAPSAPRPSIVDELEDGALLTARELRGDPQAASRAIDSRIAKMTGQQAEIVLKRIEKADLEGTVINDPHFRSLLKVDLDDEVVSVEQIIQAAALLEEATEKLAQKAGLGVKKTVEQMDGAVDQELKKGLTEADLWESADRFRKGSTDVRIAQHVQVASAAKAVRLREELLPEVIKGTEGSREKLIEEMSQVARMHLISADIMSSAGRNLGILSHAVKGKMVDVMKDIGELTEEQVSARVAEAMDNLGDADLKKLMGTIRDMSDMDNFMGILLNKEEAKAFTWWNRTINSVGLFLRSNALTPATGMFNAISMVSHDLFRNHAVKLQAARTLEKAGAITEAQALRMEERAARGVYWQAHKQGVKALLNRIKFETWDATASIASVGWGKGTIAAKARMKQETMLASGYAPRTMREFDEAPRLMVRDTDGFNARINERKAGGGAFGNLVYHMERARAVTANTMDAVGGASMKLFTASLDDWGREFIRVKETYALSTRFAIREAHKAGLVGDEFEQYAKARAKELAETPNSEIMNKVEEQLLSGAKELDDESQFFVDLARQIDDEAEQVLFMDGPQSALGKSSANFLGYDRIGLVFPYVKTPIRLFERGLINYGPFAKLSKEVQDNLAKGGMDAVMEQARIEVGTHVFNAGLAMGLAGAMTVTNGGFKNSAGLDAGPPNRLNLPMGGFIEVGRLDPFATTAGIGAMLGQALRDGYNAGTEYDQAEAFRAAMATAYFASRDVVLEKSYLKSLKDFMQVFDENAGGSAIEKILQNGVGRLIPLGGVSGQFNETFRSSAIESVGWMDTILKRIPGAGLRMSAKIDPLGDEVKSRTLGINTGNSETSEGEQMSDVKRKLRDLGVNIVALRKADADGFDMTSDELSELRRIRGKEARNNEGQTMEEALGTLFDDPWFTSLPTKDQKQDAVVEAMSEFNEPAREIMMERNPTYAAKKTYNKSLQDYIAEGLGREEADQLAKDEVEANGLPSL